ncbi:hypothetical protein RBG61_06430 [Paludicola sp. MB14-C6]|uniref:hypothetical protein n=1 Tax=Paludihabitans sp. MB14-C6 TaxID=3070656 RepID=UPI0027DDDF2E|nr:hypothetical protein [Paludicola sp. MB14-C6]WMJ24297.1 hypothetical protein RBG61_06430 [Paludicola sp. MB14-C6]
MKKFTWQKKLYNRKNKLKKAVTSLSVVTLIAFTFAPSVFANAVTESKIFKGFMDMTSDIMVALLIIAPIVCGLLWAIFALIKSWQTEPHDKEKWSKAQKITIVTLISVFGASSIIAIVTSYFK